VLLVPLLLALLGASCSSEPPGHVEVPAVEIELTLDLAIGDESGSDEYTFSHVGSATTDAAGRIYVNSIPVRVYAPDGTFLRELGGEGDGPGEMRLGAMEHAWPDGTVDVIGIDGRWVRWDPHGALLFDRRPYDFMASVNTERLPTRGGVISYAYKSPWATVRTDTATAYWILRCDADLAVTGLAARFPLGRPTSVWNQDFEGHRLGSVLPFAVDHLIRRLPGGGFVFARCDSAEVEWYSDAFELVRTTHWPATPEPLSEADYVAWHASMSAAYRGEMTPERRESQERMLRFILSQDLHETKPLIANVLAGLDGRLWIEQWGPHQDLWDPDMDLPHRYWVTGTDGEVAFQCSLPFAPSAATAEYLFEAFSDGDHTPQARRYRWRVVR
jgi:hypothetical protein